MTLGVRLLRPPEAEAVARLQSLLDPGVRLTLGAEPGPPGGDDILVAGRPGREDLAASPALRALVVPWAGISQETRSLVAEFPQIAVHNLHHNAAPVAEMAAALLLAAAKLVVPMDRSLRAGDWTPRYRPSPAVLLDGKTVLILGYGAIGRRAAAICRGLGMVVLATRRRPPHSAEPDNPDQVFPPEALPKLLTRAAALLICLPHTPETDGLIGRAELAALPAGAVLVNVGRGQIVDEAALYQALRDGQLHAAGLDVWYNYPAGEDARKHTPPSAYPFHELDNVVMSPHRAGSTREIETLRMAHLAALLNAAARGEPMPNRVDLKAGY